ncbi:MAG: metallophosphoesterase [Mogibacterium sp.]|nr:metallophosphoesterase [Mogibacterium sp.]
MKKNNIRLLLIVALLIALAAVSFGIAHSNKAKAEGQKKQTAEAVTEQTEQQAEEETGPLATVFFASDYQPEAGFDKPADTLRALLKTAKTDGKTIDRIVICGDYTNDRVLHDYQLSPDESIEEIRGIAKEELPGVSDDDMIFVQGNHDRLTEQITESGLHDEGDYLIYVLNTEEDFPWKQGKKSGCLAKVTKSSEAMKECFDDLIRKGETRPVIIAGHVPLHFTARTSSKHSTGDNLYSSLIFDVVNEAAGSLDIVYMYGHNHSKGWDCYMGGSSVFKTAGDTILIPSFNEYKIDTDTYSEETLRFTYLNAGYTGYYMNCAASQYDEGDPDKYAAADTTLTGTVLQIYTDRMVITRYDANGPHVLGHAGAGDPYKGGIDKDLISEDNYSKETQSPFTIERD